MNDDQENLILRAHVVGPLQTNCFVLVSKKTKECLIIDPGGDTQEIESEISENDWTVSSIINTHGHYDHIYGNWRLAEKYNIPVYIHINDRHMLEESKDDIGSFFSDSPMQLHPELKLEIRILEDDSVIKLHDCEIKITHVPGHTPGSICLSFNNWLFCGDLLFKYGIGRTDLPGGSSQALLQSLKNVFEMFPESMQVFPGHGESTTLKCERTENPWIKLVMEQ